MESEASGGLNAQWRRRRNQQMVELDVSFFYFFSLVKITNNGNLIQ